MSYWERRISRRRALRAGAVAGLGAAAVGLIGCGGEDDGGGGETTDRSGLITKPVDSSPKQGGTLKDFVGGDYVTFDRGFSDKSDTRGGLYPNLFKFTMAKYPETAPGTVEGEVVDTYELSGDKLQLTLKLRQGMIWDRRAPTNGRQIDSQDVLFSWEKFKKIHPNSATLSADLTPTAPITSITAPDARTVVIKFKQPDYTVMPFLAAQDFLTIQPREAESQFDPKRDIRGHSPWILEKHEPSVGLTWRRSPDYYMKTPYPEVWEQPIIPEYAQQLAQFRAGRIYTPVALPEDVVQTKRDLPETVMQQVSSFLRNGNDFVFGYDNNSPFTDVRMRQAVSMAIDRDAYAEVVENLDTYRKQGIDVEYRINSVIWGGWAEWVDPKDEKAFGPEAKYLQFNLSEAKKLMSAAGNASPEFPFHIVAERYDAAYRRQAEIIHGMLLGAGMKANQNPITYSDFLENYTRPYVKTTYEKNRKGYAGILAKGGGGWASLEAMLFGLLHSDGSIHHASSPDGKNPHLGDPKVDSMIDAMRQEFDTPKRRAIISDYRRYVTQQSYYIIKPSTSKGYEVFWPIIRNVGVYNTMPPANQASGVQSYWWIDETKAPVKKA
jgi:ABC-type transport system substrate-binding protein